MSRDIDFDFEDVYDLEGDPEEPAVDEDLPIDDDGYRHESTRDILRELFKRKPKNDDDDDIVFFRRRRAPRESIQVEEIDLTDDDIRDRKHSNFITSLKVWTLVFASVVGLKLIKDGMSGKIKFLPSRTSYSTSDLTDDNMSFMAFGDTISEQTSETKKAKKASKDVAPTVTGNDEEVVEPTSETINSDFETLVANYTNNNSSAYASVSTSDITKFIAITNIDKIVENNKELAKTLFNEPSTEEYLNDAGKVIASTVMYDFNVWNDTRSTEGFIKVSDAVMGDQRDKMIKIEEYTNRIAEAVNADDKNLVNDITYEFITDLTSGELSKLDDGVGFTSQVYIALISDGIAKDYLDQENFDMLQALKGKEADVYVSNIFTEYNGCKVLSR